MNIYEERERKISKKRLIAEQKWDGFCMSIIFLVLALVMNHFHVLLGILFSLFLIPSFDLLLSDEYWEDKQNGYRSDYR